jgi:2-polyprenyl-3-methyl-5-hydroxy-6-metoxy-1,4-benzoquinol methylase
VHHAAADLSRGRLSSGREVLGAYRAAPTAARLHTAVRWMSVPLPAIEPAVPDAGPILDFGCGHGLTSLLLALRGPARQVHAVDVDGRKLAHAAAAARRLGVADRIRFEHVTPDWRPARASYEGVVVVDVLYLLGRRVASEVLRSLARAVSPGGRLVVKEMADTPRWKHALGTAQEQLAVRLLSLTAGATVDLVPEAELARAMSASDLQIERRPLDRGYLHPHLLLLGTVPPGP